MPQFGTTDVSQATLSSISPVFTVAKFDKEGNVTSFERNNRIIMRTEYLKAVITPECLLILDYRHLNLEHGLFRELPSQLAVQGQLVTYPLQFKFRAIQALLQNRIGVLQEHLSVLQPLILETLDSLVDPNLSELETDCKIFTESILEILDDEEVLEELCLTKWTDLHVFEKSSAGIDHAEEMELLLENYHRLAEELSNAAWELWVLVDDSQSIIFINLDSHHNVMMRLNLQLTMSTFSLSLFGLMGVAFGMNLESSLEEDHRVFWLIMGITFMGSGLIWRRLLWFLARWPWRKKYPEEPVGRHAGRRAVLGSTMPKRWNCCWRTTTSSAMTAPGPSGTPFTAFFGRIGHLSNHVISVMTSEDKASWWSHCRTGLHLQSTE
ncbi:Magnesium transporter MRS2 like protein, mitochondrial [Tupaia chinensis]|uniref:Magnesium transporter n=1 Tax=Tupaia chinensis TaxID=246437 RepID=L9KLD8_TUPCH|nr:Magnesium transporter MRS2 like protein, mitochondrial [Tupaia chinensis]